MLIYHRRTFYTLFRFVAVPLLLALSAPAVCQVQDSSTSSEPGLRLHRLVDLGGQVEDRRRLGELLGERSEATSLLRTPSTLTPRLRVEDGRVKAAMLAPEVQSIWNSHLPFSFNDGALWAGRGVNVRAVTGVLLELGRIRLIAAPEFIYEQNSDFQTIPYPQGISPRRNPFASPLHPLPESVDLPLRFGNEPRRRIEPGQSSLTLDLGRVAAGIATENLWWGPGIRNAILMSNQAPGVPHLFVRTDEPLATRVGWLHAHWLVGRLSESEFFDAEAVNDHRSLNAVALTFRPSFEPHLEVGVARSVFAARDPLADPVGALLDVVRNVGRPNGVVADSAAAPGEADQITAFFGRWLIPHSGFESYVEWARFEQPASLRDLLETPNHSQGFTLGLQWARPIGAANRVRLQTELTYLEPSTTYRHREVFGAYTSRVVPQGYTHRGQVLGAGLGPAGSGQWLASDYFGRNWSLGIFGGRIRWENAAMYSVISGFRREDVSIFGGLRGNIVRGPVELTAEWSSGKRLNYLFQAFLVPTADEYRGVDIENHSLRITLGVAPR